MAPTIKEAFHIARTGRPGPVLVDLPKNVMAAEIDFAPENIQIRNHEAIHKPAPKKMAQVYEMLSHAKRPLIMTGGGVILGKASSELTALARKYSIPVTGTLMGHRFLSRNRSPLAGHVGHAWNLLRQYGGQPLRFINCRGRAF